MDGVPKKANKEVSQLERSPMLSLAPPVKLRDLEGTLLTSAASHRGPFNWSISSGAIDVLWFSNRL